MVLLNTFVEMSAPSGDYLTDTAINAHAWSACGNFVAVAATLPSVAIYHAPSDDFKTWKVIYTLEAHTQNVTGVAWSHANNTIVTVGEDRRAFLWIPSDATFKKWEARHASLLSHVDFAPTCVSFGYTGAKFAVGTAGRNVTIGAYEPSKDLFGIFREVQLPASATAVAYHPSNTSQLAVGTVCGSLHIVETWLRKALDPEVPKVALGTPVVTTSAGAGGAAIHAIAWSPSGRTVAFVAHNSTLSFVDTATNTTTRLLLSSLPLRTVAFVDENTVVAAGYDAAPRAFTRVGDSDTFQQAGTFSVKKAAAAGVSSADAESSTVAARLKFQNEARLGTAAGVAKLATRHQGGISTLCVLRTGDGYAFTTGGVDGCIYRWTAEQLVA